MGVQGGSLFLGCGQSLRRIPLLMNAEPISRNIIDGLHVTETDTLGLPTTQVALEDLFVDDVIIHRPEGTNSDTGTTADTDILINRYESHILVTGDGLYRAYIHAGRIVTLLTGHGDIETFGLPLHDLYTTSLRI
jgi:hypothetical protein